MLFYTFNKNFPNGLSNGLKISVHYPQYFQKKLQKHIHIFEKSQHLYQVTG